MTSLQHLASRVLLALAACACVHQACAETPPWPESTFSYMGRDQQLDRMLQGFAKTFGLELRLDAAMPDSIAGPSGRSSAATPTEFLNQVAATYGLTWYYQAGVLYVSRTSDRVTRLVPTKGISGAALKKAFTEMGVLEPRFGWGDVSESNAVMVSGPRSYVERIQAAVATFPEPQAEQQILVFRLKHASVDDRTIQYRDKEIVTPGVASMLRNLLADSGSPSGTITANTGGPNALRTALKPLAGEPDRADEKAGAQSQGAPGSRRPAEGGRALRAVIQSDSRLNAIIVKDKPQNAPIYRELIDMLDVPGNLIEIEAAIVDVNTSSLSDLGVDWNGRVGKIAGGFGVPGQAPDATTLTLVRGNNVNPATLIADAGNFLMTRIKALESKGNARIVSRPFILTQDNMGALIDISDTFYVQTSGERVATVTPVSAGVTLRVTPRIVTTGSTRAIQLVVDIEDGAIQPTTVGLLPTVRRSVIGTQAMVGENESLLIGGLNSEQQTSQKDQVPVLGDVPVVGSLFGKTSVNHEKRERLFLITPKIVFDRGAPAVAAVAAPIANTIAPGEGLRLDRSLGGAGVQATRP